MVGTVVTTKGSETEGRIILEHSKLQMSALMEGSFFHLEILLTFIPSPAAPNPWPETLPPGSPPWFQAPGNEDPRASEK